MSQWPVMIVWLISCAVTIPMLVFIVECVAALWPRRTIQWERFPSRPRLAILVPAHDEALVITDTLATIRPQLQPHDRLVVVADNCTDDTVVLARAGGATVVERHAPDQRGKGHALAFGLAFLSADPPDVVIMVDADCRVAPHTLDRLGRYAVATGQPVQATYIMEPPIGEPPDLLISWFSFLIKNEVRPTGLDRLGWPCLLTGSGMAFPWSVLDRDMVASGKAAEDMRLAVDLALAGHPTCFCAEAHVTGLLPGKDEVAQAQRARWEHGHLETLLSHGPRLLLIAFRQRRFELAALCLELCVPPLSLLALLWVGAWGAALVFGSLHQVWTPAWLLAVVGGGMILCVIAVWARYARNDLSLYSLLYMPMYSLSKLPLYLLFLIKRQTLSKRTERQ